MTIQEAYNKGLTDAENELLSKFKESLQNKETEPFNNPEMESLRQALSVQLAYIHGLANNKKSNIAKYARKEIVKSLDILGISYQND